MSPEEYARHDATALVALICTGEVTKAEVLDAALGRIADKNLEINAVVDLYDQPVEDTNAQGPFAGVPFLLKDIGAGISGKRTSCASRAFLSVPPQNHDDELTMRFKQSGLRILGKTNLPELGFNVTSEPVLFGPTRNPFDLTRSAGGSSGGAAAAVASGMVPIAHATDGAGSIRIPAACCGMVGLKPSRGLVPQGPAHADIYGGLVSEGVIARSVRDMKTALAIMSGAIQARPMPALSPRPVRAKCRIGILDAVQTISNSTTMPGMRCLIADKLRDAGHDVSPCAISLAGRLACSRGGLSRSGLRQCSRRLPRARHTRRAGADEPRRHRDGAPHAGRKLFEVRRGHDFARRFADIWNRL